MRVQVFAVARMKDRALLTVCEEYLKRLRRFMPTEVVELRTMDDLRARAFVPKRHTIVLDERGESVSTRAFAGVIDHARTQGAGRTLTFCIGDAHGFQDEDRARAATVLRLSELTLPHRLARVVLIEQIYRAATLLSGHPYHHE